MRRCRQCRSAWRTGPVDDLGVLGKSKSDRARPPGRHRVEGRQGSTTLLVAPARCHLPPPLAAGGRAWGWAVQLYALRSRASWGIGDLADLAGLLATTAPLGAGFALVNPLHAASPAEPSPSSPPAPARARGGRVRHTLQRWHAGSRWTHNALPNAPTPAANPPCGVRLA